MQGFGNVVSLFATVLGIVALAGGAAGYFKAQRGDSIIKYQATELDLRNEKIAGLEKDCAAASQANVAKDATISELKKHIDYLQKLSQGSPELKKLTSAIRAQTELLTQLSKKGKL